MNLNSKVICIAALAVSAFAAANAGDLFLQATLTGTGKGKAVWKTRDRANHLEAELSGEGQNLPRNLTLTVTVGSAAPFRTKTDALGVYRYSFRYLGARPAIKAGDAVTVKNAAGVTIQSGILKK